LFVVEDGKEKESPARDLDINEFSDEERIAEMGKPRLGDITKVVVRVRESMEFKVHTSCLATFSETKNNWLCPSTYLS